MKRIARTFLLLEPLLIALIVYAFWFADANRTLTLLLLAPILLARWVAYHRLFTLLPITILMLLFIALGVINQLFSPSPFHWAAYPIGIPALHWSTNLNWGWITLGCAVMGVALFMFFVEHARTRGSLDGILLASAVLGLVVGVLALGATQWNDKSTGMEFITRLLPKINWFPGAQGGFNANEIAGALAWLTPLMAGLALYRWRWPILRLTTALAFWLLLLALFLGQSRFAIAGVVVALAGVIFLLIPAGRWRTLALLGLALLIVAEVAVAKNIFSPPEPTAIAGVAGRDEMSIAGRFDIWRSALAIIHDYPLTGVGLNLFRAAPVRARYPAPAYDKTVLPHAHNEFLQVGADLGIPGMIVFIAWYAVIAYMLIQTWRQGDRSARVVAVATGAGLLAHAAFGMGDAIALWDRFIFVFWWLFGIAGAQYVVVRFRATAPTAISTEIPAQSVTTQPQQSLLS